jgi:uncharacterized protein YbaR (Trm112 family)/SAM-dependent methyltransferase
LKPRLLEVLACPRCGDDLGLHDAVIEGQDVRSGRLACTTCSADYPIQQGVPCLLPGAASHAPTRQGFSEQWTLRQQGAFRIDHQYGADYHRWARYVVGHCSPALDASDWVLDAGCGSGALTNALVDIGVPAQVVGMDFQDDIYLSAARAGDKENLHFVHGDVLHPPFKKEAMRLLASHGVLHHTIDTERAFASVSSLVMRDGTMSVWLYPDFHECGPLMKSLYLSRDWLFMGRGHRLSMAWRLRLSQLVAALKMPLYIVLGVCEYVRLTRLARRMQVPEQELWARVPVSQRMTLKSFFLAQVFVLFDNITPEFQTRHRNSEVLGWFRRQGFRHAASEAFNPGQFVGQK